MIYICFIEWVEMMSIFARLAERIETPFNKVYKANIKSHNIDILSISYIFIIKIFWDVPKKEFTDLFFSIDNGT